jgi:hypothetical protein
VALGTPLCTTEIGMVQQCKNFASLLTVAIVVATACATGEVDDAGEHVHTDDDAGALVGTCLVAEGASGLDFASGRALTFTSNPSPIPLNAPFTLAVEVLPAPGTTLEESLALTVDATMPAHGHGMNTVPYVASTTNGVFSVTGMQLHMPGSWRLSFEVVSFEAGVPTYLDNGALTVECAE